MRRAVSILAMTALMAALLVGYSLPAFAQGTLENEQETQSGDVALSDLR